MSKKSIKSDTKRVLVTLTEKQINEVDRMVGLLGSNRSGVLSYIITNWVVEQRKLKKGNNKGLL